VLFELARATEPVGVSELARRLCEARAAIHKHWITLRGLGLVVQTAAPVLG
jgi:DNA-binding IclR family transcriptional regulator